MSSVPYRYRQSEVTDLSVEERATLAELVAVAKPTTRLRLQVGKSKPVLIPTTIQKRLLEVLELAAQGQQVCIEARERTLTTQQAADRLGVSRPHLVTLIDSGTLPATKTGTHRRIRPQDLAAYADTLNRQRSRALTGLMRHTRKLGLGY